MPTPMIVTRLLPGLPLCGLRLLAPPVVVFVPRGVWIDEGCCCRGKEEEDGAIAPAPVPAASTAAAVAR